MKGVASHFKCANCENKLRRKVPLSEHYNCFRVVSNLDNYAKDTLEKEIANDDIVVSLIDIKATPKIVFCKINLLWLITSLKLITMNLLMSLLKYMKLKL